MSMERTVAEAQLTAARNRRVRLRLVADRQRSAETAHDRLNEKPSGALHSAGGSRRTLLVRRAEPGVAARRPPLASSEAGLPRKRLILLAA
jgi:hypothetical protein